MWHRAPQANAPNKSVQTNSRPPLRFEALQSVQMSECRSRFLSAAVADLILGHSAYVHRAPHVSEFQSVSSWFDFRVAGVFAVRIRVGDCARVCIVDAF